MVSTASCFINHVWMLWNVLINSVNLVFYQASLPFSYDHVVTCIYQRDCLCERCIFIVNFKQWWSHVCVINPLTVHLYRPYHYSYDTLITYHTLYDTPVTLTTNHTIHWYLDYHISCDTLTPVYSTRIRLIRIRLTSYYYSFIS